MRVPPELDNVTDVDGIRFPLASLSVTVSVEALEPLAVRPVEGEATRVDVEADAAPGIKVVLTVRVERPIGLLSDNVFDSAFVLVNVLVHWPEAFVDPDAGLNVLPVPVLVRVTACEGIKFEFASRSVTVATTDCAPSATMAAAVESVSVD